MSDVILGKSTTQMSEADIYPLEQALASKGHQLIDMAAVDAEGYEEQPPKGYHVGGSNYLEVRTRIFAAVANNTPGGKTGCLVKTSPMEGKVNVSAWTDPAMIG